MTTLRDIEYATVQVGTELSTQRAIIQNKANSILAAEIQTADSVVASAETISNGLENLQYSLSDIESGLSGVAAAFEWGLSQVVWQLEQQKETLNSILSVLSSPLETQARELIGRAQEAYGNGWIDEALTDFKKAEEFSPYNFAIHMGLGSIYCFERGNTKEAAACFEKAARYAEPKSPYYAAYAYLHLAYIAFREGRIEEACKRAAQAFSKHPGLPEAAFRAAQYHAAAGDNQRAISFLRASIILDSRYSLKYGSYTEFSSIRGQVAEMIQDLAAQEKQERAGQLKEGINILIRCEKSIDGQRSKQALRELIDRMEQSRVALLEISPYLDVLAEPKKITETITSQLGSILSISNMETDEHADHFYIAASTADKQRSRDLGFLKNGFGCLASLSVLAGPLSCLMIVDLDGSDWGSGLLAAILIPTIAIIAYAIIDRIKDTGSPEGRKYRQSAQGWKEEYSQVTSCLDECRIAMKRLISPWRGTITWVR